ncbi:MAG: carboxypeptidase-like regulatory domain-containing protein [Acidobacteriota bacterium]|nr:carboxypeptidase-like regulatory domain-containing protein [Acidobacteriota bacterium]
MNAHKTLRWILALGAWLLLISPLLSSPAAADQDGGVGLVAGKVRAASNPISSARVYSYQLSDLTLRKVLTGADGTFLFEDLPAGLYKIIAHKAGFLPTVVMLARNSSGADQFVELELLSEAEISPADEVDFWSVRQRIPTDVLREMGLNDPEPVRRGPTALAQTTQPLPSAVAGLQAELQALAGVDENPYSGGDAQVSGGRVDLDGVFGSTQVGFEGYYMEMQSLGSAARAPEAASAVARQSAMSLEVRGEGDSRVSVQSLNNRMVDGTNRPVDFERYQVSWATPLGSNGHSQISAQYTSENNFYRPGWATESVFPDASRTLRLEGSYARSVGETGSFQTELRYRERQVDAISNQGHRFAHESVELLGQGGWRMQPAVLVEYGLMTKLQDGSLSVTPRGGMVLQLNKAWQAAATASHRVHDEDPGLYQDFIPALFQQSTGCDLAEEACYKLAFTREGQGDDSLTFGALHREIGETLRLFFDQDFFNHLESLYLVRGDELPEVQLAVTRRLSPSVLARLESNLSSGGGGLVLTQNDDVLENKVKYLVTSLDTQFQETSTGVYVAFHQLQQDLEPTNSEGATLPQLDLERLQLKVTQDLNILMDLAADWALHLDMEVSRGASPLNPASGDDELRKRILGGLAVRF